MASFVFLVLTAVSAQHEAGAAPAARFTNVTEQSGVAKVVAAHYAKVPKWWLSGMDLVDLDGDGDLDLHLAGHGCIAAAARNDGTGHFTYVDPALDVPRGVREQHDIPYPGGEIRLAFDFDENGKTDILASWHDGGGVLYLNDSRPGDPPKWNFKRPGFLDHFNRGCAMADMDRDGIVDYVADAGGHAARKLLLLFGNGDGTFERKQLLDDSHEEGGPICVDIDGDGDLDLLVSRRGYHPPGRRVLLSDGNLHFTDATQQSGLAVDGGSIHGAGDLDRDGDLDLICVDGTKAPFHLALYLNDGHGRFSRNTAAISGAENLRPKSANWGGAVVTDFDNDGLPDIIVNGKYFLAVLRAVGDGKFAVANEDWGLPTGAWSAVDEGLCFGDTDADGDLDVVACGRQDTNGQKGVEHCRNDLPARNWLRLRLVGKQGNRSAAGAKIRIYQAGGLDDPQRLLWFDQIAIWGRQSFHNYYTHCVTERHFGLGRHEMVDVAVEFYPSRTLVRKTNIEANTTFFVSEEGLVKN
jgi:hypothetical protein